MLQSLVQPTCTLAAATAATAAMPHITLSEMGAHDDPEVLVDHFEHAVAELGWTESRWAVQLLPLLLGEARLPAQQLPVMNLLGYPDLNRAILQQFSHAPKQGHQWFSLLMTMRDRPPAFCDLAALGHLLKVVAGREVRHQRHS